MKPLFASASEQFASTANGVVHVFLNAEGIRYESVFFQIEYWLVKELGVEMVFHFIE